MSMADILFLSREEVAAACPDPVEAIRLVEDVFMEHAAGRYDGPPKSEIRPGPEGLFHAMPGLLKTKKQAGLKWVSAFFGNPEISLPAVMGLIVLNDYETGRPLAVMEASHITAVRTAAASGAAIRSLARDGCRIIGIVGAGVQTRFHLFMLNAITPELDHVRLMDTNPEAAHILANALSEHMSFRIEVVSAIEDAVRDADIVITATSPVDHPIFDFEWVAPGALVLPVYSGGWSADTLARTDQLVVDDRAFFKSRYDRPNGWYHPLPSHYSEIGEILTGRAPGRVDKTERIVHMNIGMSLHDVAVAGRVLENALERGLGCRLPLFRES